MEKFNMYRKLGINFDMAIEAHEVLRGDAQREIAGVSEEVKKLKNATVTKVTILNDEGAQNMGRAKGNYITIDAPGIRENIKEVQDEITQAFAKELEALIKLPENATVLLVGLGNWNATPDSLGPKVIEYSLVTRHLHQYAPEVTQGLRPVSALAPGVLGLTGIETAEIIHGVVEKTKPNLIIAIDALAAANLDRVATSIQMADTGINPGSGVGNKRSGINLETMGVPVIAIGCPTVVNASMIAHQTIEKLFEELQTTPALYKLYKGLTEDVIQKIITNVLQPYTGNLVVTPKEIDQLIENMSKIIAGGLTQALHPGINADNYVHYLH